MSSTTGGPFQRQYFVLAVEANRSSLLLTLTERSNPSIVLEYFFSQRNCSVKDKLKTPFGIPKSEYTDAPIAGLLSSYIYL